MHNGTTSVLSVNFFEDLRVIYNIQTIKIKFGQEHCDLMALPWLPLRKTQVQIPLLIRFKPKKKKFITHNAVWVHGMKINAI